MNKVFKVIVLSLLIIAGITIGICYLCVPEQTQVIMDTFVEYLNKPLGIVCGTTITLGLVISVVCKIIYDRYKINLNEELEKYKAKVVELTNQAKDYEELAKKQYDSLKADLSNETKRNEYLLACIEKICETMPNAKIKALGEQIKEGYEEYGEQREETTND